MPMDTASFLLLSLLLLGIKGISLLRPMGKFYKKLSSVLLRYIAFLAEFCLGCKKVSLVKLTRPILLAFAVAEQEKYKRQQAETR